MAKYANQGRHGFKEDRKPKNMVKVTLNNFNSLKYFTENNGQIRINMIDQTMKRLQTKLTTSDENQIDSDLVFKENGEKYHDLFGIGEERKIVCSHNRTEHLAKSKYWKTGMVAYGVF